jgi:hypothetical protein
VINPQIFRIGDAVLDITTGDDNWDIATVGLNKPLSRSQPVAASLLELARTIADSSIQIIAPWNPVDPEYGWPSLSGTCACLEDGRFARLCSDLHGDALLRSPRLSCDVFVLRRTVVEALVARCGREAVALEEWLSFVSLDGIRVAPGLPVSSAPTVHSWLDRQRAPGLAQQVINRAVDSFVHGGLPQRLGASTRSAYLDRLEDQLGYSYAGTAGTGGTVKRTFLTGRGVRLRRQWCCTLDEQGRDRLFLTPVEKMALLDE